MRSGAISTMRSPRTVPSEPNSAEIRLTIPVTAQVHAAFKRIADATKMPVGRAMGEWLADTLEAAQFMAETLEKARRAPKLVAQELHAYALGLGDESKELLDKLREQGRSADGRSAGGARTARPATVPTPPSNTGVTTTKTKTRKGGTVVKNQH